MTNQELFIKWLSLYKSSARIREYKTILPTIENCAKREGLISNSFYEITDEKLISRISGYINSSKIYRPKDRFQIYTINDFLKLYKKFIKKNGRKLIKDDSNQVFQPNSANTTKQDENNNNSVSHENGGITAFEKWLNQIITLTDPEIKSIISTARIAEMYLKENISQDMSLFSDDEDIRKQSIEKLFSDPEFKKRNEKWNNSYSSTVSLICEYAKLPVPTISSESNKVDIYNSNSEPQTLNKSHIASDQLPNFGRKTYKTSKEFDNETKLNYGEPSVIDPVIEYLKSKDIPFVDNRSKGGRLWMIGDKTSLQATANYLALYGFSFIYSSYGSKSTRGKSAWFLRDNVGKIVESQIPAQLENIDEKNTAAIKAEIKPSVIPETKDAKPDAAGETKNLAPDLLELLSDDDMQELREELIRKEILTLDKFKKENLWAFMNRYAIFNISQRQQIYKRILIRLNGTANEDDRAQFKLETQSSAYYGSTISEAFLHFCEHIAQKYPLKIRTLLDAKFNGQGSVVLSRNDTRGNSLKMMNPVAFISPDLDSIAVINYGNWICKMCGDKDSPIGVRVPNLNSLNQPEKPYTPLLKPSAPPEIKPDATPKPESNPQPKTNKIPEEEINKAEEIIKKADLEGIKITELAEELASSIAGAWKLVNASTHIVQLGDRLIYDDAFVDFEEGADKLEKIIDKLLERNDGYISSSQLYDYARSEMRMFLNDNDLDDSALVFDLAKHLFEKIGYHGKKLVFQSSKHISREDKTVSSVLDLMRNFATEQGGFFYDTDLAEYLKSVQASVSDLRILMRIYTHPIFFVYDSNQFVYSGCMDIDDNWFSVIRKALDNLFEDMGDHVILRDIQPWWFDQLPSLPGGKPWTTVLLQSILYHYKDKLNGAHTIAALSNQSFDTIQAMLVNKDSEVQTFPDAVAAFLIDENIEKRVFEADELRQLLLNRGMIGGSELYYTMPKALSGDPRFVWDADKSIVTVKV